MLKTQPLCFSDSWSHSISIMSNKMKPSSYKPIIHRERPMALYKEGSYNWKNQALGMDKLGFQLAPFFCPFFFGLATLRTSILLSVLTPPDNVLFQKLNTPRCSCSMLHKSKPLKLILYPGTVFIFNIFSAFIIYKALF